MGSPQPGPWLQCPPIHDSVHEAEIEKVFLRFGKKSGRAVARPALVVPPALPLFYTGAILHSAQPRLAEANSPAIFAND